MTTKEELEELLEPLWSDHPVWRGAEIGPGWYQLVADLVNELKEEGIEGGFKIVQIKQKFGSLRFYYSRDKNLPGIADNLRQIVDKYEIKSESTCEECGNKGTIEGSRWLRCLCQADRDRIEEIQLARLEEWKKQNGR